MKKSIATALLTPVLAFGISAIATAQEPDGYNQANPAAQEQQPTAPGISEADLKKFASVQDELDVIRGDYTNRVQAAEDPAQAAQLQQEATQKMIQVITDADMEVETYNRIAMAIENDPALRSRVQSLR